MEDDIFVLMGKVMNNEDYIQNESLYLKQADRYEYNYELWEEEGKRFLDDDFIQSYVKTKTPPTIDDGLCEITEWLGIGISSSLFFYQWVYYERSVRGKNFLILMLSIYKAHEKELTLVVDSIKLLLLYASDGIF